MDETFLFACPSRALELQYMLHSAKATRGSGMRTLACLPPAHEAATVPLPHGPPPIRLLCAGAGL